MRQNSFFYLLNLHLRPLLPIPRCPTKKNIFKKKHFIWKINKCPIVVAYMQGSKGNTMANKSMYTPNVDKQNYHFCRL